MIYINFKRFKFSTAVKSFDNLVLAAGAIGSHRIISNYINLPKRYFSRINHHPLITTIVFAPFIKYPKNHISMSNFDIFFYLLLIIVWVRLYLERLI